MRKFVLSFFVGVFFVAASVTVAMAGELDVLLEKLVEKGVLSPIEATIIKDETKQAVAAEVTAGKSYAVPTWVQKMKMKGDLRIRHQYERKNSDTEGRNRGRVRLRLGVESKVVDKVKVGFGLATGGTDPRSTNKTLENTFETPDIRLDYAYAEYTPVNGLTGVIGKFKRKKFLWAPTDLLWDGDINPNGASVAWKDNLVDNVNYFTNAGIWILDANDQVDKPDPFMKYVQAGLQYKEGIVDVKGAGIYYGFHGVKDNALDNSPGTNTTAGGVLVSNYNSVGASGEVGFKKLFGGLPFDIDERIAFFGDYILNLDDANIEEKRVGHAFGVKFGNKKVKKPGQWQMKYIKAKLGKDAFIDAFPDSDRFGGKTDVSSHEVAWKYALKKNVIIGVDYYQSRPWADSGSSSSDVEHLVQADLLFKF